TLQVLAGHPQFVAICLAANVLFAVYLAIGSWTETEASWRRKCGRLCLSFVLLGAMLVFSGLIGAVQWLPTYDLLPLCGRSDKYSLEDLREDTLTVSHMRNWVYPFADGNPAGHFCSREGAPRNIFAEATPYIGLLPLLLGAGCFFGSKRRLGCALLLFSAVFIAVALGERAGLYTLMWRYVPHFASFRSPFRWAAPVGCFLAMLAGLGMQCLYEKAALRFGEKRARQIVAACILLTVADFAHINWAYQSYLPSVWFSTPPSASILDKQHGRVLAPMYMLSWRMSMLDDNYSRREAVCYMHRDQLGPELASLWGIASPDDYAAHCGGLSLLHSGRLQFVLANELYGRFLPSDRQPDDGMTRRLMDYCRLQNVTHAVFPFRLQEGMAAEFFGAPAEVAEPGCPGMSVWVYPLKDALPRVRLVADLADRCPAEILDIDALWSSPSGASLYEPGGFGAQGIGSAEIAGETPNTLTVRTKCDRDAHLFIANTYSPNWQAFIDGSSDPQPLRRTDYAFHSLPISAGEHTVLLKYTCPAFWRGLWISLGGLAALAILAAIGYRCRWL
ncbi:YfhO family protein, partial [bacterium]|nr:YfhO family protein [bacterium]